MNAYEREPSETHMPLISRRGESFALKDMTQMTVAGRTSDLDSLHAECSIHLARDRTRDGIEEGRPATATLELCIGSDVVCFAQ